MIVYALRICEDGYFSHFGESTGKPVEVLLHHALFYKNNESFNDLDVKGEVVKVNIEVVEDFTGGA